jgi:FkbM family methyltransferase
MKKEYQRRFLRRFEQACTELHTRLLRLTGAQTKTLIVKAFGLNGEPGSRALLRAPLTNRLQHIQRWSSQYDRWLPILMESVGRKYPDETIVDVGANVGDTVIAGRLAGCQANIVAIEASHKFAHLFRENLASNAHLTGTTTLVEALVIGRSKDVKFEMHRGGTGKTELSALSTNANSPFDLGEALSPAQPVKTVSLDDLKIDRCSLLKIDTDGFDAYILDGGMSWIERTQPIIWAEAEVTSPDAILLWRQVLVALKANGFASLMLFDNEGALCFSGRLDETSIIAAVDLIEYSLREMRNFRISKRLKKPVHYLDIAIFPEARVALWADFDQMVRSANALVLE